jgi:hypothetical protein
LDAESSPAARFGSRLAVVNAKFDTGIPPNADQYEVVLVDGERRQPTSIGWLGIGGWGPAAVQVAAAAPTVGLRPELAL